MSPNVAFGDQKGSFTSQNGLPERAPRPWFAVVLLTFGLAAVTPAMDVERGKLGLEQRVAAQKAIERVYWSHRIWPKENPAAKPELAKVLSDQAIRARVEDTLRKSNALEKYWHRPVTAAQLQAELNRMAAHTHAPAMLREMFAALGNDPRLIAETLARRTLVDRLIRNWYATDDRFHGELKKKAEAALAACQSVTCMQAMGGEYRETTWKAKAPEEETAEGELHRDVIRLDDEEWQTHLEWLESLPLLKLSGLEETAEAFVVTSVLSQGKDEIRTATVTWPKLSFDRWWQTERETLTAQVEDTPPQLTLPAVDLPGCAADTWAPTWAEALPPSRRTRNSAVWTGTEMIVWGGDDNNFPLNTGGRYDPSTDTWTPTSRGPNVPAPRSQHTAVWTGTEMIVWGGFTNNGNSPSLNTGGRYSPSTDTWIPTSTEANVPAPRYQHTAVWTGTKMIVWGGYAIHVGSSDTGGRYDPSTDTWTPTSTGANVPAPRAQHTAVWTGTRMIVWGGVGYLNTGGRYDPSTDTWTPTSTGANVPAPRYQHTAVWTGTRMIVWGGFNGDSLNTGGRYDPSIDTWTPTSTGANVPTPRARHIAVWTGAKMIVWGGYYRGDTNTGGRYDPFTDTWIPTSTGVNVPPPSEGNTAVWTATEMIVWGGGLNTVGRYDPYTDTWIPPSTKPRSPIGLANHAAVWTGTEMIVWGGYYSGERYDPSTDNWTPTSTGVGVPQARRSPTAVWTGTEMIVWGGAIDSSPPSKLNTGGRYDPSTDSWTQTSTGANVPIPREGHSAVWTGTEMIIWGGFVESCSLDCCFPLCVEPDMCWFCNAYPLSTGGRYDPSTDTWTSTSTGANVPTPRENHTAIWTGTEMIVWGGGPSDPLNTGGRYDPSTDTWTPTPTGANLPAGRQDHTAIWSGSEMIVWGGNDCYVDCCDVDCADFCSFCNAGSLISGGRYDPSTDTWTPTSTGAAVPTPREGHTAVWTGKEMIIWGGFGSDLLNTGGRYDPSINTWTPTSTGANVPTPREGHSAVWNGTEMIVWGGSNGLNTGGLYCACPNGTLYYHDADGDGYGDPAVVGTSCDGMVPGGYAANPGDCNDANASLHPGAPELCNGIDDDCNGVIDDGFDGDHDGFSACAGDCDDGNAAIHPGAVELCDGRDNDCDGIVDGFTTVCGVGACFRTGSCIAGVDSCAPASPSTEICDGIDNDCDGSVDNVPLPIGSPSVTIDFPSGVPALRWTPLPDATRYDVVAGDIVALLSSGGDFTSAILGCLADDSAANALDLSDAPAVGTGFFYLVRGENCGGPGTYDSGDPAQVGSCNAAINASPLSCPQCGDGICSVYENYDTCFDDCWY